MGRDEGEAKNKLINKVTNTFSVTTLPAVFLPLRIRLNENLGCLKRDQEEEREIENASWRKVEKLLETIIFP